MASCFMLLKQFDDVLIYLTSIQQYSYNDDIFQYNYGVALCAAGRFKEAEEALLAVTSSIFRLEYCYLAHLSRCYIMNGKAREAWKLYIHMESTNTTESFAMLILIANDCYKVGAFFFAAKAFDVLGRLEPGTDYWDGKRGACCGVFQQVRRVFIVAFSLIFILSLFLLPV
jgi:intraflagellar transport protein 56